MSLAEEYERVLGEHRWLLFTACSCGWKGRAVEERFRPDWTSYDEQYRAHVAQTLAADPGVRAAVQREALREAARLPAATLEAAWDSNGFALRALTPPWSYLRRFLNALAAGSESTAHPQEPTDERR